MKSGNASPSTAQPLELFPRSLLTCCHQCESCGRLLFLGAALGGTLRSFMIGRYSDYFRPRRRQVERFTDGLSQHLTFATNSRCATCFLLAHAADMRRLQSVRDAELAEREAALVRGFYESEAYQAHERGERGERESLRARLHQLTPAVATSEGA